MWLFENGFYCGDGYYLMMLTDGWMDGCNHVCTYVCMYDRYVCMVVIMYECMIGIRSRWVEGEGSFSKSRWYCRC